MATLPGQEPAKRLLAFPAAVPAASSPACAEGSPATAAAACINVLVVHLAMLLPGRRCKTGVLCSACCNGATCCSCSCCLQSEPRNEADEEAIPDAADVDTPAVEAAVPVLVTDFWLPSTTAAAAPRCAAVLLLCLWWCPMFARLDRPDCSHLLELPLTLPPAALPMPGPAAVAAGYCAGMDATGTPSAPCCTT